MELQNDSKPNTPTWLHWATAAVVLLFALWEGFVQIRFLTKPLRALDLTRGNITAAVNHEREVRNLVLLSTNPKLQAAAQYKSDDMVARRYFSHTDPEGNYLWPRIVSEGYTPYAQLGENLAIEFYSTESLVAAWMNSPTHRANILQDGFRDQGVGLTFGNSQGGEYHSAVANAFGRLLVSKKPSSPTPTPAAPVQKPQVKASAPKQPEPKPETQAPVAPTATPPSSGETREPIAIRGEGRPEDTSFSISPRETAAMASPTPAQTSSAPATVAKDGASVARLNRNVTLGFGIVLLLLLLLDIQPFWAEGFKGADKKLNNVVLLLMALAVVAFMYWF